MLRGCSSEQVMITPRGTLDQILTACYSLRAQHRLKKSKTVATKRDSQSWSLQSIPDPFALLCSAQIPSKNRCDWKSSETCAGCHGERQPSGELLYDSFPLRPGTGTYESTETNSMICVNANRWRECSKIHRMLREREY